MRRWWEWARLGTTTDIGIVLFFFLRDYRPRLNTPKRTIVFTWISAALEWAPHRWHKKSNMRRGAVWYPIIPVRALLNMAIRSGYLGISSHRTKSCLCAEKVWKISGRDCGPVRRLDRFLETYPFFYDERCHWDLGLWILTKHGLRSGKHWNLWSLWKRFQERFGMTGFRILCVSRKCNA